MQTFSRTTARGREAKAGAPSHANATASARACLAAACPVCLWCCPLSPPPPSPLRPRDAHSWNARHGRGEAAPACPPRTRSRPPNLTPLLSLTHSATAEAAAPTAAAPTRGRPSEAQSTSDKYAVVGECVGEGWREGQRRAQGGRAAAEIAQSKRVAPHTSTHHPSPTELGGQQLLVEEGRWYSTDRLAATAGSTIALGRVLAVKSGGAFRVGTPYVEGAVVEATVLDDAVKGPKLTIAKFKNKSHYKRKTGHRQPLSTVLITKIA